MSAAGAGAVMQRGFGLTFLADEPLPGLPFAPPTDGEPVRVHLQRMPRWLTASLVATAPSIHPDNDTAAPGIRRLPDGHLLLDYEDATRILVHPAGTEVWSRWPSPATLEDTATYLLGPVAALVLRLRGVVPLHASVIEVAGGAVAFAGPSGAGKSTTAAAFSRLGHRVVSDDVAAIIPGAGPPQVQPAFPRVRLWSESVAGLYGRADALPPISVNWDKRYLDAAGAADDAQAPLPLAAVYLLQPRAGAEPALGGLAPRDGLVALLSNTSANWLLDAPTRARDLRTLAHVAAHVPLQALTVPDDFARLPDACALVLRDLTRKRRAHV